MCLSDVTDPHLEGTSAGVYLVSSHRRSRCPTAALSATATPRAIATSQHVVRETDGEGDEYVGADAETNGKL